VPIRGTSFVVLTHSDTREKLRDLRRLVDFLELPAGFVEIGQTGMEKAAVPVLDDSLEG
jgi:hypothetical protein